MKQLWFGIGLLVFLLLCSIFTGNVLEEACLPIAKDLDKAAGCVLEEDWDLAAALLVRAESTWQSRRNRSAVLVNHDPLDRIDLHFARLKVYSRFRSGAAFSAGCAELARELENLSQTHGFAWWNLL